MIRAIRDEHSARGADAKALWAVEAYGKGATFLDVESVVARARDGLNQQGIEVEQANALVPGIGDKQVSP